MSLSSLSSGQHDDDFRGIPPVLALVGATAVGKSELSLDLAEILDAEIINADSMQLYSGMDIGTAKLPEAQRRGIPHHLLDVLAVTESNAVSDYQVAARRAIREISSRGKRVVVVGGSGLFVSALLENFEFPGNDPQYRSELETIYEVEGVPPLFRLLQQESPETAARIDPSNHRRIIRALEIIRVTGLAPSAVITQLADVIPNVRIGLRRDRTELDSRINSRVNLMWKQGLVEETIALTELGLREGKTARQALGYSQVLDLLDNVLTEAEAVEATKVGTRKFARRQDSWFNRDKKIHWLSADAVGLSESCLRLMNK